MSAYKRIDGDYVITTINETDNVVVQAHTVKIEGNLDVIGNITYIESTDLEVTDPFITLAANNNGGYSNVGILAQYNNSPNTFASVRFNVTQNRWEYSNDNSTFYTFSSASAAGANTYVQFNDGSGAFGANINLTFDKATSILAIAGYQNFKITGTTPSAPANGFALYANTTGSGGTGAFIKSADVDDELVSKAKAIVYSIIF
jgi:hypothetical protein